MQQSVGTSIRKLRREQNLTQSELGGTAFSKSYVSAVESNKLTPSREALRHFALELGKPANYFSYQAHQEEAEALATFSAELTLPGSEALVTLARARIVLLEPLFERLEFEVLPNLEGDFELSEEILSLLTPTDQAHYGFFQSLVLQKKAEYGAAIEALELAVVRETHPLHTIRILYELGKCYLSMHFPQTALSYILRARQRIAQTMKLATTSTLPFSIELEGGYIALVLGFYQRALEFFEQAQIYLNARQSMEKVGRLYWGLGYSTYALAYQQAYVPGTESDVIERLYQRGLAYLLQSRNIAQMASDGREARARRVVLAMIQLDWCAWRWRCACRQEAAGEQRASERLLSSLPALLDDAGEQCRQILASFQGQDNDSAQELLEQTEVLFIALALLVRMQVQRALLAATQGYESTFQRERSFASSLCQQALDACADPALIESIAWNVGKLADISAALSFSPLPLLPEFPSRLEETPLSVYRSRAEVFFAAGEVAEMLGRTASEVDFVASCYARADSSFQRALDGLKRGHVVTQADGGYITRMYQRYTLLLEERVQRESEQGRDVSQTAYGLLALCKQQLFPGENEWPF